MKYELKVYIKSRTSVVLVTPELKNRMEIQGYLTSVYGLLGWEGFDILRIF